jgi:serine/threonine protein phosphatase 1
MKIKLWCKYTMANYQLFGKNLVGTDYVVGDIHGNYNALMYLLKKVGFNFYKDRLFSVGDLTDRGLENLMVVNLIKENWFFPVRGNHEDIIIDIGLVTHEEYYKDRLNRNGNEWFFRETNEQRTKIIEEFKKLPYAIQVDNVGIIHAYPDNCWEKTLKAIKYNDQLKINSFVWNRSISKLVAKYNNSLVMKIKNIDCVIVGHQIQPEVQKVENIIFLDTGFYEGGELSVINLDTRKVSSVSYGDSFS